MALLTMALLTMALLTMALLTMALLTMALLTMALLTMALLTMALLTMALLTMALLTSTGRVQEGEYYALYSRAQERRLSEQALPEMARVPLEALFLQVKALGLDGGDARSFLGKALQPPAAAALDAAATALVRVGALSAAPEEKLTPLGQHLARMPLEPRIGKTLIYGALLGCVDPALTIAAAMSLARSPFLSPFDKRAEAQVT